MYYGKELRGGEGKHSIIFEENMVKTQEKTLYILSYIYIN